jgi:hypothetical protein
MKNYIVKSDYVYDVLGGARWTFEQKRATRYTREEAIARADARKGMRAVKLVSKKNAFWVIRRRDPIQYPSREEAIEAIGFTRGALKDWKVVKVRP